MLVPVSLKTFSSIENGPRPGCPSPAILLSPRRTPRRLTIFSCHQARDSRSRATSSSVSLTSLTEAWHGHSRDKLCGDSYGSWSVCDDVTSDSSGLMKSYEKNFWNFKLLTIYLIRVWLPIAEDSSSNVSEAAFSSNIFDEVDVSLRTFWFLKSQVDSFPLKSFSIWSVFEGEIGGKPLLKEKEFI